MNTDEILAYGGRSKVLANGGKFKMSFDIASRTRIIGSGGVIEDYVCCEPCRSERVLRQDDMIFNEVKPYRITPVFGINSGLTYRIGNLKNEVCKTSRIKSDTNFGGYTIHKKYANCVNVYFKAASVISDIEKAKSVVARTTYFLKSGEKVVVEYPCKTINYNIEDKFIQVDTGMVVLATNRKCSHITKAIRLAYVAFCNQDTANFIMEDCLYGENDGIIASDFVDSMVVSGTNEFFVEI